MKYLINSILLQIKNNLPKDNEELLVKISGFENAELYCNTAKEIDKFATTHDIKCNIKLANKKFQKFSKIQYFI